MEKYYVSCGAFGGGDADIEYYVAVSEDGTVVARGLSEDRADEICEAMNAAEQ